MAKKKKKRKNTGSKPKLVVPPAPPPQPVDAEAASDGAQERMLEVNLGNVPLVMIELLATVNKNLCVIQAQLAKLVEHSEHKD